MSADDLRAEIARRGRSQASVYRAIGWSDGKWKRRLDNPDTWTLGELRQVAQELGIPVRQLLAQDR